VYGNVNVIGEWRSAISNGHVDSETKNWTICGFMSFTGGHTVSVIGGRPQHDVTGQ